MKNGFSIKSLDTYEWPVDVQIPTKDAETGEGKFETHRFTGIFKHQSKTELENISNTVNLAASVVTLQTKLADLLPGDPRRQTTMALMFAQVQIETYMQLWQGWGSDLTDLDGVPLPYSDEMKRKLLEERVIREAVSKAHQASQNGEAARVKN